MSDTPETPETPPPAPDDARQPTREELEAWAEAEHNRMMLAVDAVHINAVSISRLVGMEIQEVPRLLVSGSCRSLEKLCERYQALRDQGQRTGERNITLEARLKREISAAAEDLHIALGEGVKMADQIRASLGDYGTPQ